MKRNVKNLLVTGTIIGMMTFTMVGCQSTVSIEETKEASYTISTEYKTGDVDEACAYKAFMNDNERKVFDKLVNLTNDYRKDVINREIYAKEMKKLYDEIESKDGFLASNMKDIVAKVDKTDLCDDEELDVEMDMLMNLVLTVEDNDKEIPVENNNDSNKIWTCPVCGGTDCPKESECNNAADCLACGEFGVVGKDLEVWSNSQGERIVTHKGQCTEAMKLEDQAHRQVKCGQCGQTVSASDIVDGICYDCRSNTNIDTNTGLCPNCGMELAPNGKCADCGYGY